jgi:nucleotide-binding universal stress UspA family protein
VVVVREPAAVDELMPGPVVVGTDATEVSTDALDFAFDLASTEGLSLHAVHNVGHVAAAVDVDEHHRGLEIALAGYEERYPDVEVHRHLPLSSPADTLSVLSESASVVVVGARAHHGPSRALGSVSRAVVERARCPVVVVSSGTGGDPSVRTVAASPPGRKPRRLPT